MDWIINYIGPEGFRESVKVESESADDFIAGRNRTIAALKLIGADPDMKKIEFKDNGTKPGKLAQRSDEPRTPSKLDKLKKPEAPTSQDPDQALASMAASGFLTEGQAVEVAKSTGLDFSKLPKAKAPEAPAGEPQAERKPSKLDKLKNRAPVATPVEKPVATPPNTAPALGKFVAREKKAE